MGKESDRRERVIRISVVTSAFNAQSTIADTLRGVARQTTQTSEGRTLEIEHIVQDGASTDDTANVARRFPHAAPGLVSEPDRNHFDGMNRGVCRASGDIVGILNADDFYFSPNTLASAVDAMEDAGAEACYGNVVYVDPEQPQRILRIWRSPPYRLQRFMYGWMPPHPAFFVRRACYERFGAFREDLGTSADYELMLRFLLAKAITCVYVPELWVAMRAGGASNESLQARLQANYWDREAWKVNGLRPPPWLRLAKPLRKVSQYARRDTFCLKDELAAFDPASTGNV